MQLDGLQVLCVLDGKGNLSVPRVVGRLFHFQVFGLQCILPIKVDMIGFTNIPDTTSKTGVVRIIKDIELDIAGKNVLVVEDIIRTGLTTAYIIQNLEMKRPREIRLCSMLVNPDRLLMTIPVHYCGFEINDQWLAGYGLDKDEIGRNLPYIAQIPKRK